MLTCVSHSLHLEPNHQDCTAAAPKIRRVLAQFKKPVVLLECPVLRSEYKGNAHYAYRHHPLVQLEVVPQLVKWVLSANGEMVSGLHVQQLTAALPDLYKN